MPRRPAQLEAERQAGATVIASPAETGAEVILGLVMSDHIPDAYFGEDGNFADAEPGTAVLTCWISTLAVNQKIQAAAPKRVVMLDTPIISGVKYARERGTTSLVCGPTDSFERTKPILDELGKSHT